MRRRALAILVASSGALAAAAACSSFDSAPPGPDAGNDVGNAPPPPAAPPPPPPPADAAGDGGPPCDPEQPFGKAALLPVDDINTSDQEDSPTLTSDELTIVFTRNNALHRSVRTSRADPFPAAAKMGIASAVDQSPWLSPDGLELVFASWRTFSWHIYRATRANVASDFSSPDLLPTPPPLDPQLTTLAPNADGGKDLWIVSRVGGDSGAPFGIYSLPFSADAAVDAASLVASRVHIADESSTEYPVLSPDGLTLYVTVRAPGDYEWDISVTKRASLGAAFSAPAAVSELNTANHPEHPGWVSPDGCRIYFASGRLNSNDIWVAERGK